MRVLIGSESFYPNVSGVSVTALNLATYLVEKGHEVVVAAPSPTGEFYIEDFPGGIKVWRVFSVSNPWRSNFKVSLFPERRLMALVDEWQPDVIHLQDPNAICLALIKAADKWGIPTLISHHFTLDYILTYVRLLKPVHPYIKRMLTKRMIKIYNSCRYVLCPSETVKTYLVEGGLKVPVIAISNGVDLDRFFSYEPESSIRASFGLPALPIVLYVGRIDPEKSIKTLLQAAPMVLANCKVHFVLCGNGKAVNSIKRRIDRHHLEQHFTFLGPFDHESSDLPRVYQTASCFVIPSPYESQSIVTLEAMASGLPVVAAASGALPELVGDGENGFLFNPGDPGDLAMKLNMLLDNTEMRKRMGLCSLEKVVQHNLEENLHKIEEIYTRVVGNETA
ncbi:MAG: glycosyltransferase [Acidobacteriota bacterium]